jgi:hypothetical protein
MPEQLNIDSPPSITSLLGGIVDDVRTLVRQEIALARRELRQEWDKAKAAFGSIAVGAAMLAFSGLLGVFMLVHFLHWVTGEALPLWGCYGIIGGSVALIGASLLFFGAHKAADIHVVPPRTAETMKENVQWIKNQT